ncbi:MAG: polymer-forming cytoskeletal protein [Methanobacterium sp.]|nr:polymer-forming cytoskeletal protein [Methanobacterium sp.]
MEKSIGDLKINGSGSSAGGKYDSVIIKGHGDISGDLDCIYLKINGHGNVDGNVMADSVKVNGNNLINGNLEAGKVKINGMVEINGNFSVEKAETYGSINVDGDCNAEFFKIEGTFAIEGLLNAGELELSLYGSSKAREIGGEKITVKKKGKYDFLGLKGIISGGRGKGLTADIIEGDDIYLENTHAKVVRGNNIELGPGCEIEQVEYKDSFKQDEKAAVDTHKKI